MNDLDKLKSLLFGEEKESLNSIRERVEHPETRACDVADILPEAIYQSHKNGDHLRVSLTEPVRECIEQAVHEEPQKFGDALYPVMGPAIRRSIMQALRGFAQQINTAVEHSLTLKGLNWRFKAWRAGVPFGNYVLQETLLYRVEQAYLIGRDNGLLMGHVHHAAAAIKDTDAVSAMFTAIQDFVKESFSPDRNSRLETADMGEFTLWAIHGPHAVLACVIRGVPPKSLRPQISGVLERVHFRYGDAMRAFAGDTVSLHGVDEELEECLKFSELRETRRKKSAISPTLLIILLLIAAGIAYLGYTKWSQQQRLSAFNDALRSTPGMYINSVSADGDQWQVTGLRDPLAVTPQSIAETQGLNGAAVNADMQPFQSLAPEMIVLRAERQFGRPPGTDMLVEGATLVVTGPAPIEMRQQLFSAAPFLAGIDAVSFRASPDELASSVQQWLAPPDSVTLAAESGGVTLTGVAPAAWIARTATIVDSTPTGFSVELSSLRSLESVRLSERANSLSGTNFFFVDGVALAPTQEEALPAYVEEISALREEAALQDLSLVLALTGYTDSVGNQPLNEQLAARRTATVAQLLIAAGQDPELIEQRYQTADDADASIVDHNLRRVSVELRIEPLSTD